MCELTADTARFYRRMEEARSKVGDITQLLAETKGVPRASGHIQIELPSLKLRMQGRSNETPLA